MRHAAVWPLAAVALALAACGAPPSDSGPAAGRIEPRLVGTWYGNAYMAGDRETRGDALVTKTSDGRFSAAFRVCSEGVLLAAKETGNWSVHGDILTTVTETLDGNPVPRSDYYTEHYRLKWLTADQVEETDLKLGAVSRNRRVAAEFEPPPLPCPR